MLATGNLVIRWLKGVCTILTCQNKLAFGKWRAGYKLTFHVNATIPAIMPATR